MVLKITELLRQEKTWRDIKCILLDERSQSEKSVILYDSNYMILKKKKKNDEDSKKINCYQGLRGRRNGLVEHREFRGSGAILCASTMANIHH